jgi:rubredoxin
MNELKKCDEDNEMPSHIIKGLNISQGGTGRHKCVICAYTFGKEDGEKKLLSLKEDDEIETCKHDRKAIKSRIKSIHENQAPTQGRHKCAICAYSLGYDAGLGDGKNDFDEYNDNNEVDNSGIYGIVTYGTSAEVVTVFNRMKRGTYYVPTFQRDYVWKTPQASSLIESLIMQLPIPAIFLVKDEEEKHYIIDGQQRLTSIKKFYDGDFALTNTIPEIKDKKYNELSEMHRNRLDEYALQLIIVKQEKPDDNNDAIYKIFERINTAGTKLTPQEIRSAAYHGDFSELLTAFTRNKKWMRFIGGKNNRRTHQELILKFFALYFDMENYKAPMKHFLNVYMSKNRNFELNTKNNLEKVFNNVFDVVERFLKKENVCLKNNNRINTQLLDSILVAIAKNINNEKLIKPNFLQDKIEQLKNNIDSADYEYKDYWESRRTSKENVEGRCKIVIKMFSEQ